MFLDQYKIQDCECTDPYDHAVYVDPNLYPEFQGKFVEFKETLKSDIKSDQPKVYLRLFDGEFFFLKGEAVGNVCTRHTSVHPSQMDLSPFYEGVDKSDYILTQLYPDQLKIYSHLFPNRPFDFPMEYIYGIVANREVFTYGKKIGLICGEGKARVIEELMKKDEYKNYLGLSNFESIITVPELHACDNVDETEKKISTQFNDDVDLYLFGIGISKLALAHRFKKYSNATFLDIGCGVSALAGMTSTNRPYFGKWTNYRLKDFDYSGVDPMDSADSTTSIKEL
jgi:hypothetical protein